MSTKQIMAIIGERLKQIRLNRNITQQNLADMIGVSRMTIVKIEKGSNYNLPILIDILKVFNMTENLESLVPEQPLSPLLVVEAKKKMRKKASKSVEKNNEDSEW